MFMHPSALLMKRDLQRAKHVKLCGNGKLLLAWLYPVVLLPTGAIAAFAWLCM